MLYIQNTYTKLALRYFEYVAKRFPVMYASDEFHFLPRAETADMYYDRLDNFEAEALYIFYRW